MKNKKRIFVIVLLILVGLAAVMLARTGEEKVEENALSENEVVDSAEVMEEQTEEPREEIQGEIQGEIQEEQPVVSEEETKIPADFAEQNKEENEVQTVHGDDAAKEDVQQPGKEVDEEADEESEVESKGETAQKNAVQTEETAILPGNLKVCEVGSYIGGFVEDGSDEFVNNIMMIVLENQGNEYIQLANVKINDQYLFEVTTLFPGEKVMVLEKNRSAYVENMEITSTEIFDVAVFREVPTMCEEILKIEVRDGMINVENISGEKFPGGKVFFKTVLDDKYLGGITYFSNIPELEKGQAVKLSAGHFQEGRSEMLFVTYAE